MENSFSPDTVIRIIELVKRRIYFNVQDYSLMCATPRHGGRMVNSRCLEQRSLGQKKVRTHQQRKFSDETA